MNLLITITFFILSLAVVSIDAEFRDDSIFKRSDGQDLQKIKTPKQKIAAFCQMNKLLCASFQKRQEENKAKKQREERISNILRDDTYLPHFTNQETIEIVDNIGDIIMYCLQHKKECPLLKKNKPNGASRQIVDDFNTPFI